MLGCRKNHFRATKGPGQSRIDYLRSSRQRMGAALGSPIRLDVIPITSARYNWFYHQRSDPRDLMHLLCQEGPLLLLLLSSSIFSPTMHFSFAMLVAFALSVPMLAAPVFDNGARDVSISNGNTTSVDNFPDMAGPGPESELALEARKAKAKPAPKKAPAKAAPKAKPAAKKTVAKPKAAAKPASKVKPPVKPAAKPAAKPKPVAKPAAKPKPPAGNSPAKPGASKPAKKPVAKPAVKPLTKSAKPSAKPSASAKSAVFPQPTKVPGNPAHNAPPSNIVLPALARRGHEKRETISLFHGTCGESVNPIRHSIRIPNADPGDFSYKGGLYMTNTADNARRFILTKPGNCAQGKYVIEFQFSDAGLRRLDLRSSSARDQQAFSDRNFQIAFGSPEHPNVKQAVDGSDFIVGVIPVPDFVGPAGPQNPFTQFVFVSDRGLQGLTFINAGRVA
ncbi:hypothetical protein B0H15DRAFT_817802 [Mycena belliarum]|uniref:Uncharacterized protein n=1 Tax=Mycena belliarum TaxID=1033014 RepID=A0AAD6XY49_9AGAR|nr:hypothetical protein B0H15DRAFT_817802 [Mycena belliae]